MSAPRELDAWLAERFGWVHAHALGECAGTHCWHHPASDYLAMYPPAYSSSYEGMGLVLEALKARGFYVQMHGGADTHEQRWSALIHKPTFCEHRAEDESLPLAVALAAKAALQAEQSR